MANVDISNIDSLSFVRVLLKEEIPIILMSSRRNEIFSWRALVEGACFFLEKPISFDDLKYVWQHSYIYKRRSKTQLEDARKPEQEILLNRGNISQVDAQVHIFDENSVKESQNACNMEQHLVMANDQIQEQGGLIKTKRSLDDDRGGEKKRNLNSDNENSNSFMVPTEEKGKEMNENNNGHVKKKRKPRIVWTSELHLKFIEAVSSLGDIKARPKLILQKMNVPGLTQRQVASHLQNYKARVRQISDNVIRDLSSNTGSLQTLERIKPSVVGQPTLNSNDFAAAGKTQGAGTVQVENASGISSNVANSGKSLKQFSEGNQEVKAIAVLEPPAASSVNAGKSAYAALLKFLDEDEEEIRAGLGGELKPADLDRYCEWLREALMEKSEHSE
ncbi:putative two-component response regulator-like APRR6 [Citrus sinensis]|uniref:Two-component response regulator-like APRR6 n=1 Tax=Citrus sinensis TaxID=2711 RepID=A0ACB8NBM6_CITSI|nr:putative two-component response regulator-like APRR6 [Citrus sinensis]